MSLANHLPQHQGTTGLHLRCDPIPWLLEEENPSVRYLTLTHLLGRPEDDPQVAEARAAIPGSKDVQAIFARQDPAGWWDTPERTTGIKRASGQLLILSRLGVLPDERTRRGCEFVLSKPWLPTRRPVCIVPCYTANCLRLDALEALAVCGYASDSRFRALAQHVVDKQQDDGRWLKEGGSTAVRIERKGQPSKWITLKALRVLKKAGQVDDG